MHGAVGGFIKNPFSFMFLQNLRYVFSNMAEELKKHLDNIETTVEAFVMACLYNVENAKNLKEVKEVVKCGLHKTMKEYNLT